jgi:hypothetical protein
LDRLPAINAEHMNTDAAKRNTLSFKCSKPKPPPPTTTTTTTKLKIIKMCLYVPI